MVWLACKRTILVPLSSELKQTGSSGVASSKALIGSFFYLLKGESVLLRKTYKPQHFLVCQKSSKVQTFFSVVTDYNTLDVYFNATARKSELASNV